MSYLKAFFMDFYREKLVKHYKQPLKLFVDSLRKNALHLATLTANPAGISLRLQEKFMSITM